MSREVWSAMVVDHAHSLTRPVSRDEVSDAATLLGSTHPLVRVMNRRRILMKSLLSLAALWCASLAALVDAVSFAPTLLAAASVAPLPLACALLIFGRRQRERAMDLIIEGGERLPVPALQRVRRELLEPQHRFALAEWLDALRESVRREARAPAPLPLLNVRVVASVMPELEDVARLLRTDNASARGVAGIERLLRHAGSPMHGDDPERLREEVLRIRVLLRRSEATT